MAATDPHMADPVEDVAHAGEFLRECHLSGFSVMPCGRRSRLPRVLPEAAPDRWLSLRRLDSVLWLDAADQTCEVEAGMSPADLQLHLDAVGLELPVLCPSHEEGTLGGLFQSPETSLLEDSCGPARDFVLGGTWLLADGTQVRTGARVVKSVAGYDVTRLLLGSRGRLAILLSLILKLRPKPKQLHWVRGPVDQTAPADRPTATEWPRPRLQFLDPADDRHWLQFADCKPHHKDLQPADSVQAEQRLREHLRRQDCRLPQPSPWLADVARACAPGAPRFGERR